MTRRRRLRLEDRLLVDTALAALPAVAFALVLVWATDLGWNARWTMTAVMLGVWAAFALTARSRTRHHLQTLSSVISALREGDYSIRGRSDRRDDAFGDAMAEVNALADTLRAHDVGHAEATALLAKVTEETDVAMFAFDASNQLRMINRAGAALVGHDREHALGRAAEELGLDELLVLPAPSTVPLRFGGRERSWELRRTTFREAGRAHTLVVLSDVSRALREEERQAWQRLVRVLSHEINNSLTPISSIAASLRRALGREIDPATWADDASKGLEIIERRAEVLARFMKAYAELARLPQPELAPVDVGALVERAAQLETRIAIRITAGPVAILMGDVDQLEQLLINLLANAAEAAVDAGGGVELSWTIAGDAIQIRIRDEGQGLADTTNLFVPFFTTKPGGSGIGLALSRQIAEAHDGRLTLENRSDRTGCIATLVLPLATTRSNSGSGVPQVGPAATTREQSPMLEAGPVGAREVNP